MHLFLSFVTVVVAVTVYHTPSGRFRNLVHHSPLAHSPHESRSPKVRDHDPRAAVPSNNSVPIDAASSRTCLGHFDPSRRHGFAIFGCRRTWSCPGSTSPNDPPTSGSTGQAHDRGGRVQGLERSRQLRDSQYHDGPSRRFQWVRVSVLLER
ncbi:hypothetical protein BCR44DRAFT_1423317 [Catenaria anguillulae PL171]|uniref:Uncharacterized protein n=1 Tax=Catenaria anguillulae PL171 TaxID=765915 RepID=A0A1Y2I488_9FUNG|nr:hypothetical protein BCR44DRAFT_1423317 [Catenaria anguillulae PL171]